MTISAPGIKFLQTDCHRVDSPTLFLHIMKDLSGLTYSFQEWGTLLDFLVNLRQTKVRNIQIARKDEEWAVRISEDKVSRKPARRGVSLYDLYW